MTVLNFIQSMWNKLITRIFSCIHNKTSLANTDILSRNNKEDVISYTQLSNTKTDGSIILSIQSVLIPYWKHQKSINFQHDLSIFIIYDFVSISILQITTCFIFQLTHLYKVVSLIFIYFLSLPLNAHNYGNLQLFDTEQVAHESSRFLL